MTSSGQPVNNLLPSPGFAEGWVIQEKIETFTEKDLYKYINGEAELYYPYGFKALATAKYVRSDNPDGGIIADIYEMGSPLEAFGIYSRYRDPDEESVNEALRLVIQLGRLAKPSRRQSKASIARH